MPRLFFAVETPEHLKAELIRLQDSLVQEFERWHPVPDFKREKLENSHCTIRFLGNVEALTLERMVHEVRGAFEHAPVPRFDCALSACSVFPNRTHARVLWVGLTPEEPFREIQRVIDTGLAQAEIPFEADHSFHPHLTLFRFRERLRFPADVAFPNISTMAGEVMEVQLIESKTLPKGPVHTVRARFAITV